MYNRDREQLILRILVITALVLSLIAFFRPFLRH